MILPASIKSFATKKIKEKSIPNLLIYSYQPGSGKSTFAKAICKDLGVDYLYINVSDKGGVDTLRDDISKYASTISFNGNLKTVIMDEFDGASQQLQKAMRAAIEEYAEICRFIFTCNNITQVIEPIKSRCELFHFSWTDLKSKEEMVPKILKRLINILTIEKVQYDEEVIKKIISMKYPDIRSMLVMLEKYNDMNNGMITNDILTYQSVDSKLYQLIYDKHISEARKMIVDQEYDIEDLYRALFDNYIPMLDSASKKGHAMILVANYMNSHPTAIDKHINFAALLVELSAL
jgi:DNA polymerase III delta prime subunit